VIGKLLDWLWLPLRRRQERLMRERGSLDAEAFVTIAKDEFERRLLIRLWDYLRAEAVIHDFRPAVDDDLLAVYRLAEEEVDDDIILNFMTELGIDIPPQSEIDAFGPINTPRKIVQFMSEVRQRQSTGRTA
jgi:hypothetical protein